MNAFKTLLAVSVLTAAGAASATTVGTFNVTVDGDVTDWTAYPASSVIGTNTGTGTATLDDSGLLTVDFGLHLAVHVFDTDVVDDLTLRSTFTGTYNSGTGVFTINDPGDLFNSVAANGDGQETALTCTGFICDAGLLVSDLNTAHPYNYGSVGTVSLASGGTIETIEDTAAGSYSYARNFHLTAAPTVPVPAAAWLFGSGLLGLAGTARRRSA